MANLNDLPLTGESIEGVDPNNVPLLGGGRILPPQPGLYVTKLPTPEVIFNCFDRKADTEQGEVLVAEFYDEAALWLEALNIPYRARITNKVRYVKVNDPDNPGEKKSVGISDMAQLLRVVNSIPENKTSTAYGHALIAAGTRLFKMEHTLTATCAKDRDIYKDGAVIKGKKGCGAKYATEVYPAKTARGGSTILIPQDEKGKWAVRFECSCGANLTCWGQIKSFRQHQKYPPATSVSSETEG